MPKTITFKNDDVIFREGDIGDCLYYIENGRVSIYKSKGQEYIMLNEMYKGEIFGTLSLLNGARRTAKAIGTVTLKKIDSNQLLGKDIPIWYQAILKDVIHRFNALEKKYLELIKKR